MASTLVVTLVKYALLALLWVFVLAVARTVRTDLYGARAGRSPAAAPAARSGGRERRSSPRRLVVTEGPLAGTSLKLGAAPVTLGRADESTLVLTDDYASSHHARLAPRGDGWVVEDLGSTNGTFLGAQKVVGLTALPVGQPLRIGQTVLELRP